MVEKLAIAAKSKSWGNLPSFRTVDPRKEREKKVKGTSSLSGFRDKLQLTREEIQKIQEFFMGSILPCGQDAYYDRAKIEEMRSNYAKIMGKRARWQTPKYQLRGTRKNRTSVREAEAVNRPRGFRLSTDGTDFCMSSRHNWGVGTVTVRRAVI